MKGLIITWRVYIFIKKIIVTEDLCYICEQLRHPTTENSVTTGFMNKNIKLSKGYCFKSIKRKKSTNLLPSWAKLSLIHTFDYKKGPKLVCIPRANL